MEKIEDILTVPVQLTEELRQCANEAGQYRAECGELKAKAESLRQLLRMVARGSNNEGLCMRPMRRIMQELEKSLAKALVLVRKCKSSSVFQRVLTIMSANDFKRVNHLLDNALADITWLLNISGASNGSLELHGLPPIASSEPMIGHIWENISALERGNDDQKEDAASSLGLLARDNDRLARIIIEEGAVVPLVKVLTESPPKAREAAARSLGYMAKDVNTVKQMIADGIAPAFVKVLISSPMRVQIEVARTLSETVWIDPAQQETYMEHQAIRPLVSLLGESLEEPEKMQQAAGLHKLVATVAAANHAQEENPVWPVVKPGGKPAGNTHAVAAPKSNKVGKVGMAARSNLPATADHARGPSQRELSRRERDSESAAVKEELKAEVARALWMLVKGNPKTCKSLTETRALLCFATLMDKWGGQVRFNSVMALMEIAAVAEKDVDLKRAAFKMSLPSARAVVGQLSRLIEDGDPTLQVPCIRAIGCLSRTFPARETRVLKPLVKQLESTSDNVAAEAVMALEKFACTENFLHKEHSQAIVEALGAPPIVQIIYFGEGQAQISAVILMCYLALNVGESEELAKAEPLPALKGFTKNPALNQHPYLDKLLGQAITRLQIFQEKGARSDFDYSFD